MIAISNMSLTKGALETIITGGTCEKPIIQVLGVKKIQSQTNSGPDRYRLLLSDGVYSISSVMLATQLNHMVENGSVDNNCIICMQRYICNAIQTDKKVIVLLELQVITPGSQTQGKIGDPQALKQPYTRKPQENNVFSNPPPTNQNVAKPTNTSAASHKPSKDSNIKVYPIASLTPYTGSGTIKGRITLKTKIRTWSNAKGEGQLFSFNIADQTAEIKVTAFKNEVDRFHDMIEVNKAYYVMRGQVKAANKQFSNLPNDYELTLTSDSQIIPVADDEEAIIPQVVYNFVPINKIQECAPNTFIDVIGVVRATEDVKTLTQRATGKELHKREVQLVDQSETSIGFTLWGDNADKFDGTGNPILALRGCRVSDWNGRSLGESANTQVLINPALSEADTLRGWYDRVGSGIAFADMKKESGAGAPVSWKNLGEVEVTQDDKPEYFNCKATLVSVKKDSCVYTACPQPDCNKKVVDLGNNMYRCEKCAQEFPSFKYRLILQMNICDFDGSMWQTCFQEVAEQILGESSQRVGELKESNSPEFEEVFNRVIFTSYIFRCRSKTEKFNDENRLKTICLQVTPIDFVDHSERLLGEMSKILGDV